MVLRAEEAASGGGTAVKPFVSMFSCCSFVQSESTFLTFWFSYFGPFLVMAPKG